MSTEKLKDVCIDLAMRNKQLKKMLTAMIAAGNKANSQGVSLAAMVTLFDAQVEAEKLLNNESKDII